MATWRRKRAPGRAEMMSISTAKMPTNRLANRREFRGDIVPLQNFNFKNPRTWEVIETKGSERSFWGHGTWEVTENKAVVGNVRNRNIHRDKLPLRDADFSRFFRG